MESKSEFKNFDDIISINDFDLENFLLDETLHKYMILYTKLYIV